MDYRVAGDEVFDNEGELVGHVEDVVAGLTSAGGTVSRVGTGIRVEIRSWCGDQVEIRMEDA
jgi:sporulation protein YlmC with PRC-barrel domain